MPSFKQLNLSEPINKVLEGLGFESPTEIQEQAIPILLENDTDFIGLAQTGTGKTLAFGIPLLEKIDVQNHATQALILAPTRELGIQIAEQLSIFSAGIKGLNCLAVYGGASIVGQMKDLKRPQHIIIATPGRLLDLIKRKAVKLEQIEYLVLDEADEMLTMGFKDELDEILATTPEDKLTWLFSATMSGDIRKIIKKFMHDPKEVHLSTKHEMNQNITHYMAALTPRNKPEAIARILDINPDMKGVVFCRTKISTQELAEYLMQQNYKADALHGDLSQAQRDRVMKAFKKNKLQVLVATDIAARGIDVSDITHVIHNDLPDDPESFTHRSGRTARAGKEGISIALVSNRDFRKIDDIKRKLKVEFKEFLIPTEEDILESKISNWVEKVLENDASDSKKINAIYNTIKEKFETTSKDDLIKNLILIELKALSNKSSDINETLERPRDGGGRGGDRGRGRGGRRDGGGGGHRGGGSRGGFSRGGDSRSGGGSSRGGSFGGKKFGKKSSGGGEGKPSFKKADDGGANPRRRRRS